MEENKWEWSSLNKGKKYYYGTQLVKVKKNDIRWKAN